MWMENFFTNIQQTNWTSGITAEEEKDRIRQAEVAISLFKVVDAKPGQELLPLTLYSIPFKSRYTRPNISKKECSK
jgi:hypothetical protein